MTDIVGVLEYRETCHCDICDEYTSRSLYREWRPMSPNSVYGLIGLPTQNRKYLSYFYMCEGCRSEYADAPLMNLNIRLISTTVTEDPDDDTLKTSVEFDVTRSILVPIRINTDTYFTGSEVVILTVSPDKQFKNDVESGFINMPLSIKDNFSFLIGESTYCVPLIFKGYKVYLFDSIPLNN